MPVVSSSTEASTLTATAESKKRIILIKIYIYPDSSGTSIVFVGMLNN